MASLGNNQKRKRGVMKKEKTNFLKSHNDIAKASLLDLNIYNLRNFSLFHNFTNLGTMATFWNGQCPYAIHVAINEVQTPFCTKSSPRRPKAYSFYAVPVSCDLAQLSLSERAAGNIQSVCSSVRNWRLRICFTKKLTGNTQD